MPLDRLPVAIGHVRGFRLHAAAKPGLAEHGRPELGVYLGALLHGLNRDRQERIPNIDSQTPTNDIEILPIKHSGGPSRRGR